MTMINKNGAKLRREVATGFGTSPSSPPAPDYDIPQSDIGKSHQYSRSRMSDPSNSVNEINVPEISDQRAEFVYNFYTQDERVAEYSAESSLPLNKIPRYVTLSWTSPRVSDGMLSNPNFNAPKLDPIEQHADKILSEDNFFNRDFINHTFSDVDAIEQGASDMENYSRITRTQAESVFKMSKYSIKEVASNSDPEDPTYQQQIGSLTETYTSLADIPKSSLGLRVFDEKNVPNDEDDLIRSIAPSLTLTMKINKSIIPDVFENSKVKESNTNYGALKNQYSESLKKKNSNQTVQLQPVYIPPADVASYYQQPVRMVGYEIIRYRATNDGFRKEKSFYVEDIQQTRFEDRTVLYGVTYVYSIRVVAAVVLLSYKSDMSGVVPNIVYVGSRVASVPVECYEYTPPPEPENLRFFFDYKKRNVTVLWDMPVNPQQDVKQFQVFRRKSIKEPFELIAQYGFDTSVEGPGASRYRTGERIDANGVRDMLPDDLYLVKVHDPDSGTPSRPIYQHVDEDFTVDVEFLVSSDYIYSVCAIDAHGMISNYSSQHKVTFDPYKNKLVTQVVCDSGSPRQYPNMKLRRDAFKDVISVQGDSTKRFNVYFTPEYLKVRDDRNHMYKVVEGQTNNSNSYYLLQLINLDNQKLQLLRVNIRDPQNLTR
jgi:hypothetical protein